MLRNLGTLTSTHRFNAEKEPGLVGCNYNLSTDEEESRGILRLAGQIARPNTPCKMRDEV